MLIFDQVENPRKTRSNINMKINLRGYLNSPCFNADTYDPARAAACKFFLACDGAKSLLLPLFQRSKFPSFKGIQGYCIKFPFFKGIQGQSIKLPFCNGIQGQSIKLPLLQGYLEAEHQVSLSQGYPKAQVAASFFQR